MNMPVTLSVYFKYTTDKILSAGNAFKRSIKYADISLWLGKNAEALQKLGNHVRNWMSKSTLVSAWWNQSGSRKSNVTVMKERSDFLSLQQDTHLP